MDMTNPFTECGPYDTIDYDVDGDLSLLQYTFVELDTSRNRAVKAWSSGIAVGVLRNSPVETPTSTQFSRVAIVQHRGVALIKAGSGGLAVGNLVKPGTGGVGDASTPTDGDLVYGIVLVGATAGLNAAVKLFDGPVYASVPGE